MTATNIEWLADLLLWSGLKTIFSVERTTTANGKATQEVGFQSCVLSGKPTCHKSLPLENRKYDISSLACSPENLLAASRSHWKIESMHWMLDVIWNEDTSGILSENGNKTLNSFRKLALLAHKRFIASLAKKPSVKSNVLSCILNDNIFLRVIESL